MNFVSDSSPPIELSAYINQIRMLRLGPGLTTRSGFAAERQLMVAQPFKAGTSSMELPSVA